MSFPPTASASEDERRPLLQDPKLNGNGTIERAPEHNEEAITDVDGTPLAKEPSTWECLKVMFAVWLGTFLAALDSTIVATLTAPISASFNSLSLLSWIASGYLIANAAFQPISGKLTDIYGRRAGLIVSNILFCAGNVICASAQQDWVMILGRVVAGAGGGCLNTISTFVGSDLIPLRRRGVWQGLGNINYGLGMALGGVFGGVVNDSLGWRWAFWIQVPLTMFSTLLVFFTVKIPVKETDGSKVRRIDFLGSISLVTSLVLLLLGLNSGGNVVPWNHPLVYVSLPASVIMLTLFVYIETRVAEEPIIPISQMKHRTVLSACFTNWFCAMAMFTLIFYAPIYFQVQGLTPTQAGERLIPFSVGIAIGSLGTGIIMRSFGKYYWLSVVIMTVNFASYCVTSLFELDTPTWIPLISFFGNGLCQAGMLTVTLIALISAVDHKYQAVITSASYAFRSTGSTIGITIASAVFQNLLKSELWEQLGDRKNAAQIISEIRNNLDYVKSLPPDWKGPVLDIYMDALRGVFLTTTGLSLLALVVSLFMKEHKLYSSLARRNSS
ncbi:MAG: hypothetical protein LQ340_006214 [Diploschistes diacapsis]|nr:MAG: hypothetical protein LQ340_006214 [Diploschistes diacapsis]